MVREVMVGAGLAPAPLAFLGLQVPIPLGIPSLCPAELSIPSGSNLQLQASPREAE